MNKIKTKLLPAALLIFTFLQIAGAQTNSYTYQGRLTDNNATANGSYDLQFALYDAETGGSDKIRIFGLGTAGSTALCRNADNEISTCAPVNLTDENRDNIEPINTLRKQINEQQIFIDALKKIVCASNPAAAVWQ